MPAEAERAEIERVVQLYIDGARDGDASKLRDAFHPDARMFGNVQDQRVDVPIDDFFAEADGHPADVDGSFRATIVSVEKVGSAASVRVDEEGFRGTLSFTDFFTLSRIDGRWFIVNKTFAHTAGDPPTG